MSKPLPFFSIIIPTYNRPDRLTTCLQAIAKLDYPPDRFEVIVVDDGSAVPLDSLVSPLQNQLDLRLIRQPNSGPAKARNVGAATSKGEFLVFTDDDCVPTASWLSTLAAHFVNAPDCLIGGHTLNALPDNLYSTASQLLIDYLYEYYNADAQRSSFFASNNFALPAARSHTLGGFDTSFPLAAGEDREFCDRWLHHQYSMVYASEAQIYHAHKLTLRSFWQQHFNYGRGAFCFHQIRAQRTQEPLQVEPLSFYSNLLLYPFRRPRSQPALLLMGLLSLSQVANVMGFIWERSRQPNRSNLSVHLPNSTLH